MSAPSRFRPALLTLALAGAAACGVLDGLTGAPERPPDGSSDAGTADAGTADAGTADAGGIELGRTDAGTADAGTADAGTTDPGSTASAWTWRGPVRLDPAQSADAEKPALAVRPNGRLYAAWTALDQSAGTSTLWLATRAPGAFGWDPPKKVPGIRDAPFALFPQLAVGARGQALVAYLAQDASTVNPSSVRVARFDDTLTVGLSDIVDLVDGSAPSLNWAHSVAVDEDGEAIVTWLDGEHEFQSVSAAGTLWSSPRRLDATSSLGLPIADVAASHGQTLLAWPGSTGTFAQVSSIAAGTFAAGAAHWLSAGTDPRPHVVLRGDIGFVAWKAGSGVAWDRVRKGAWHGVDVVSVSTRVGDQVALAMNAAGRAVVVWQEVPAGSTDQWEANLYGATFDGSSWSAPQLLSVPGPHRRTWNVAVDMNEHGDALVAWTDFDQGGTYSRLWANLLRATPGAWSGPVAIDPDEPQARQASHPESDRSVRVALQPDGSGATVIWADEVSVSASHVWENRLQ